MFFITGPPALYSTGQSGARDEIGRFHPINLAQLQFVPEEGLTAYWVI
jgi:hypothetical protein